MRAPLPKSAEPAFLPPTDIGRHYHPRPYATLVLEGSYEEAGDRGRFVVEPGDVLFHPAFSAHRDVIRNRRTRVLDIALPFDARLWPGQGRSADADLVIRTARTDVNEARALLLKGIAAVQSAVDDPADRLADALSADPCLAIAEWTEKNGWSREWLSRRFRRLYGIDSATFRLEARTRIAWRRIFDTPESLAQVALSCGFSDQAHMTRAVGRLTGRSPRHWRVTSVQESQAGAR